jgi:hypothetical protein
MIDLFTSKHNNKLDEFVLSINPASWAAFLMKYLCSSLQRAGTVITHLTLAGTIFPTYSLNLFKAFPEINFNVWEIMVIKGIYLPSIDVALASKWSKWILYYKKK